MNGYVERARLAPTPVAYRALMAGFILSLALALLTLVDVRRGFLFADYEVRTLFYVFNPAHVPMLAVGIAGMFACYRGASALEEQLTDTSRYLKALTFIILALLVVDLFVYRGVPAARSMASHQINLDWMQAFGVRAWWRPIAQATSYLLNVWHATMLGILISGLAFTILPVYLQPYLTRTGFSGTLLGAVFALPQPFCSCCSSVMAPSFVRRGASINFVLSFVIGSPMLNVTTIVLALALLPAPFAITRIAAGVVIAILVTYLVARLANAWAGTTFVGGRVLRDPPEENKRSSESAWMERITRAYLRLFDIDRIVDARTLETPSQLFRTWLRASGRIALVLVPTLWVWSVISSWIFQALPSAFGNNLPSVVLSAIAGTFFMISTWSEIPMALQLIDRGFNGPAATLLVVLPAISLPCMMLLGGSLRRFRLVAMLSAAVIVVGIMAGTLFL